MSLPTSYEAYREMEDERNYQPSSMSEISSYQHATLGYCDYDCARCQPPEPLCYTCGAYEASDCHCVSIVHPTRPYIWQDGRGQLLWTAAPGQPAIDLHTGKPIPVNLLKSWWGAPYSSANPPF